MKIENILNGIPYQSDQKDLVNSIEIIDITDDSRDVREGYLFIAVNGENIDGHQYIEEAIENGASLIIGDREMKTEGVPYIRVGNSKEVVGLMARNFFQTDQKNKRVVGVTGTNGKTTTSYMVKEVLETHGFQCGVIGTIQNIVNGQAFETINTTPNPIKLHRLLNQSYDDVMIIEVSSHALKQHRVKGVEFDVAIFTNLEREHLDYHATMEDYFETKFRIFKQLKPQGTAIMNRDNSWGEVVYRRLQNQPCQVKTISTDADSTIQLPINQSSIRFPGEAEIEFELLMPGEHNRLNAAMTLLVSEAFGLERKKSVDVLRSFTALPGRFESIYFPGNRRVVIDYAHTTKGIYYCLKAAKECRPKRIIHVFGFRGNRDESKRSDMLIHSAMLSDYYILTFDDLNEIPEEKMENTLHSYQEQYGGTHGEVVTDRSLAIKRAIDLAEPGDMVVITGKGHERYQQDYELGTVSDRDTVEKLKQATKDMTV